VPYFIISNQNLTDLQVLSGSFQLFQRFTDLATSPTMPVSADEFGSIEQLANAAQGLVG
jgi:hypothetical protein